MDDLETVASLKAQVIQFRNDRDWEQFHDPKNLVMGLAVECAELQEIFLWKTKKEVRALLEDASAHSKLREELADVFVFLLYLSEACHVDLSQAVRDKLALNKKKYPVDKCFGSNKKYDELG
jgi:NTP pyrophosphatase (non-canonical NTP hydrolase)